MTLSCPSNAVNKRWPSASCCGQAEKKHSAFEKKRSRAIISAALSLGDYTEPTWMTTGPQFPPSAGTLKHGVSRRLRANVKITVEIKECICPSTAGKRQQSIRMMNGRGPSSAPSHACWLKEKAEN